MNAPRLTLLCFKRCFAPTDLCNIHVTANQKIRKACDQSDTAVLYFSEDGDKEVTRGGE